MKSKTYSFTVILHLLLILNYVSCDALDLDINTDPDALSIETADPNFILNGIQLNFINQNFSLSTLSSGVVRHTNLFGTYASSSSASELDEPWENTYTITNNLNLLKDLSTSSNLDIQVGIGQVLEAWCYINLVDYIGTAVYSEAVNTAFPQPKLDSGESIYDAIYNQLDIAIINLNGVSDTSPSDIFYNGDISKWIKVANTLKLKMYIQSKLVSSNTASNDINAIINSGNYIKDSSDDFQVSYGNNVSNPDTRHPWYILAYEAIGAGQIYMSNDFMYKLKDEKGIEDPRLPFYIYRQYLEDPSEDLLPCSGNPAFDYCYLGEGYWGRDHGDDEGILNDGDLRSTFGIYPAGGALENYGDPNDLNNPTGETSDLGGAGIYPIWLSSFSKFMLAESSLPFPLGLNTEGNTIEYITEAIQDSFNKVANFSNENIENTTEYISYVTDEYNSSTTNSDKLNIIMREYYIAMWGNSIEAYNNYRRTGFPLLQNSVIPGTNFPRSYFIPETELNTNDNPNLVQKTLIDQVFWDTNAPGFIN